MPSYTADDALTRVYRVLRDLGDTEDTQLLSDTMIADFVGQAVKRYSVDRPAIVAEDVTADGTRKVAYPTGWEDGFSAIRSIEYPVDEDPPSYLDPRGVAVRHLTTGPVIYLAEAAAQSAKVRVVYTSRQVLATLLADTTVPDADFEAVCDLAVGYACEAIAQKYARQHEPIVSADYAQYRDKADVWAARGKRYRELYRDRVPQRPASAYVNWDYPGALGSWWLTHPTSRR